MTVTQLLVKYCCACSFKQMGLSLRVLGPILLVFLTAYVYLFVLGNTNNSNHYSRTVQPALDRPVRLPPHPDNHVSSLLTVEDAIVPSTPTSERFLELLQLSATLRNPSPARIVGEDTHSRKPAPDIDIARFAQHESNNVNERFAERLQTLQRGCGLHGNHSALQNSSRSYEPIQMYPPEMNVSVGYCGIEKTASWTMKVMFQQIRTHFDQRNIAGIEIAENATRDLRFLFVREPYSRLLSAYVDKLFSPNPFYWSLGRYIIEKLRVRPSDHSLLCGHDVTFPELIRYVIEAQTGGMVTDPHFTPSHEHCGVCKLPHFHYIGHLETFTEDVEQILHKMGSPVGFSKPYRNVTLEDDVYNVFVLMLDGVDKCMTRYEAVLRLWKKWQIRGLLSKSQPFPLSREATVNITLKEFFPLAMSAAAKCDEQCEQGRKEQKKEALMEAFQSIPYADKLKLKELLFLEFELFGYPPEPEEVFPKTLPTHRSDPFSYFALN